MPDINSFPSPSPSSTLPAPQASSTSQQMPPPANPALSSSLNILPSNQSIVNNASGSSLSSPQFPPIASPGIPGHSVSGHEREPGQGPGPLRHPRPMTAADLHHELEKEQEAVVNRLTRELSLLRAAANASVASNASSTSASHSAHGAESLSTSLTHSHSHSQIPEPHPLISGTSGFTIPSSTGRLHHTRTASNTSIRSASQIATAGSSTPAGPRTNPISIPLSRQGSQQSQTRRSRTSSPAPGSESFGAGLGAMGGYFPSSHSSRYPYPTSIPTGTAQQVPGSTELSPGLLPGTRQFEETAFFRSELESVKRENETLRRRIRELERMMRNRRASDASRPRSSSVSTTASASVVGAGGTGGTAIAGPRAEGGGGGSAGRGRETERDTGTSKDSKEPINPSAAPGASSTSLPRPEGLLGARDRGVSSMSIASSVAVGVPEEEVQVGESAASRGVVETTPQPSPLPQ